jgi:CMP-N,N'-diacetyllegionaminic acid synthase
VRVLAIVPARAGSKRIKGKNLAPLGGKPLVAWAIDAACAARRPARVVVSSDDPGVLELAGALALPRPPELCTDDSPAIDYVKHAIAATEAAGDAPWDAICIVQATSPFTTAADVDATIELCDSSGADAAVSVMQVDHALHPFKFKKLDGTRLVPFIEEERGRIAAHQLPKVYVRNGSVYVARRATVAGGDLFGRDCRGFVMPHERSLDVNEPLDLEFARFLLERRAHEAGR